MFVRNGIRSNLRERGRTALFSSLIVFLTVTMILSLSVLLYCSAVMDACDEAYRSIALIEYMGSEYPDEDEPDAAARAAAEQLTDESVLSVPGVTAWSRGSIASAYAEGYNRINGITPYDKRGVIVVGSVSDPIYQWAEHDENGDVVITEKTVTYYTCFLKTSVYSKKGRENTLIDILPGNTDFVPEKGKSYVLNGTFVDITGSARRIGDYPMNGLVIFRVESFLDTDDLPYAEYHKGEDIPKVFLDAAEQYRIINNYINIVPCRDVNDAYVFQQSELRLAEGDMPDPDTPYSCVVSADLANDLGLKPGDAFTLNGARGTDENRYRLRSTGETQTFTVSGIAGSSYDHCGTVWAIMDDVDTPLFGYVLGTASLVNETAEESAEALQAIVPDQVRVTLLDQGYANAVQPFREVKKTAINVLIVCSAGVCAVLLLFAFLFVGRQNATVRIMVSLGTPGRKIALWFLSGAMIICGASAVLGTVLGTALRPAVLHLVAEKAVAARTGESPLWYSETLVGVVKQLDLDPQIPLWPNLLAALAIVALALVFCLLFLRLARRSGTRKRGKSRVYVPHGVTSVSGRGGLRFALLSIHRGGLRSLVVPLVSLVLTVAIIVMGGMYQGWQNELDDALDNTDIDGMVVTLDGRYYSGLFVTASSVKTLMNIEGVDDVSVSYGYHYWLDADMPAFNDGDSGKARREEWIYQQPEMVALNALEAAKEFYYADPAITWLEGWDETMLKETDLTPFYGRYTYKAEDKAIPAVLSTDFLEEHSLVLGDTIACYVKYETGGMPLEIPLLLQAVGSYVQQEGKAHIYVPLACHVPPELITGGDSPLGYSEEQLNYMINYFSFRTCRFRLRSARDLDTVRKQLKAESFSYVGHMAKNRTTLLIRDASFLKFKESMERNIAIGKVMSYVISLLIVLLGFIISWLMTFSRRREFALMRGFGAKKRRVFASFFLEQAILSFIGCAAGCAALIFMYAGGMTQPLTVAAYIICYLLGTAISILLIGKTDLMELLTVRD